jgi:hypothetical protein
MRHHRTLRDLTRPQVGEAVPGGLVRRHAAWLPGNRRGAPQLAGPCHTRATTTETYSQPGSLLAGRSTPPAATPACALTVTQRARREVEWVSVRDCYDDPQRVGVSPAAPTHRPASSPPRCDAPYPAVPATNLTALCSRASKVVGPSHWQLRPIAQTSHGLPYVSRHPADG